MVLYDDVFRPSTGGFLDYENSLDTTTNNLRSNYFSNRKEARIDVPIDHVESPRYCRKMVE